MGISRFFISKMSARRGTAWGLGPGAWSLEPALAFPFRAVDPFHGKGPCSAVLSFIVGLFPPFVNDFYWPFFSIAALKSVLAPRAHLTRQKYALNGARVLPPPKS